MNDWHKLAPGPQLRRIIAERRGWHMRKIWVGSNGVEYDFLIYDHDDRYVYQREITLADLADEQQAVDTAWLEAMDDAECPRWDEDLDDALDLVYGLNYELWADQAEFRAWVNAHDYLASAETEALALTRAWLSATEGQDDFLRPA